MREAPATFTWDGDVMVPIARDVPLCNRQFVVGEQYRLIVNEDRSQASHSHYFACVTEAWKNLPEDLRLEFPSPEKLRAWALCRTSEFYDDRKFAMGSPEEARRLVAFMKGSKSKEYFEYSITESMVVERRPESQSYQAMGKERFQRSKEEVLEILSDLIGVTEEELSKNAGKAA